MLQIDRESRGTQKELERMTSYPPPWNTTKELDSVTNDWMRRWLSQRSQIAQKKGLFACFCDYIDKMVRTGTPEHTDNPNVSPERKLKIVRNIHRTNLLLGVYKHYIKVLTPLLSEVAAVQKRPVRVLELASGSGEMAMYLASLAEKNDIPMEITGSDYVEDVVLDAQKRAMKRGLKIRFRTINAFDMEGLSQKEYDIFLIVGTMHHFTPGQLAVIMAQSRKYAGSAFIGIDGYRSMALLLWLPIVHLITFSIDNLHDSWLTARKFYTLFELEYIARLAVPDAQITVAHSFPGLSVLKARF
ncbi:MAG: methyltransferase domain-containing protein [Anaerolineales bacterium]|nr:methyltransferase domain-containing protein [Anaerolineales bacterium]